MTPLEELRYLGTKIGESFYALEIEGPDAQTFLHNQTTNNIKRIPSQGFQLDTLLDISGRVICYFFVVKESPQKFILLFESEELSKLGEERLKKYLIAEELEISSIFKKEITFCFNPQSERQGEEGDYIGDYFSENCALQFKGHSQEKKSLLLELKYLRGFEASSSLGKLITDSVLFELALDLKKGCFLGQETTSKIVSRRGAAFYPMALKLKEKSGARFPSKISIDGKKIGTALAEFTYNGENFLLASLLRDYRVEGHNFNALLEETPQEFVAKSFPMAAYQKRDKARELYDKAVELFQKDEEEAAIKLLELVILIDPSFEDAYESLGVILGRHEKFERAIELMQRLSEVNPKSVMAHTNMSLYYMRLGNIEEAEKQKAEATVKTFEHYGDEAKRKQEEKRREEEKLVERKRREEMFKQVLEIDSEDALALYGLGDIEFEKGNLELSESYMRRVLKTDSKYSVAYLLLGKILMAQGKKEQAREKLSEGLKVASSQGEFMPANEMQRILNQIISRA